MYKYVEYGEYFLWRRHGNDVAFSFGYYYAVIFSLYITSFVFWQKIAVRHETLSIKTCFISHLRIYIYIHTVFKELSTIVFRRKKKTCRIFLSRNQSSKIKNNNCAVSKYWSKWLLEALQLQAEQFMLDTITINNHLLQKNSHTKNLQNIQ